MDIKREVSLPRLQEEMLGKSSTETGDALPAHRQDVPQTGLHTALTLDWIRAGRQTGQRTAVLQEGQWEAGLTHFFTNSHTILL